MKNRRPICRAPIVNRLAALAIFFVAFFLPQSVMAQSFSCGTSGGTGYCSYNGKLSRVYINEGNTILIYFEQAIDTSLPATVGISGVTTGVATRYSLNSNAKFADYLYSTALTALAGDKTVSMQFRSASGYLIVDRIWIFK